MAISNIIDAVVETPIVSSFSRIGYDVRKKTDAWTDLASYDLGGRVIVLTGATSGIGFAAALRFAAASATLVITGRRAEKNELAVEKLKASSSNDNITQVAADMGDLDEVRTLAAQILSDHDRLDVLAHNAGTLSPMRRVSPSGMEATVASQVVGPFLTTSLLLDLLQATNGSRVLTMSSGGMYGDGLSISNLELSEASYNGTKQYARAKRAQVTLNEIWADRFADSGVVFHALHPGWVDTPGVDDALPGFAKIMGPVLRTPDQGADTLVWLAADDEPLQTNGKFWHDRRVRNIHKLPSTGKTDTPARRDQLWEWVVQASGVDPT